MSIKPFSARTMSAKLVRVSLILTLAMFVSLASFSSGTAHATLQGYHKNVHSSISPARHSVSTASFPTGEIVDISTCDQLQHIDDNTDTEYNHYRLTADIDCSAVENFVPIGLDSDGWDGDTFKGVFDGQGHTISNVTISSDQSSVGLFSYTFHATLENLVLTGGSVAVSSGSWTGLVGSLVGQAESSTIRNVISDVPVAAYGSWAVGGIVGYADNYIQEDAYDTLITDCSYTGDVEGSTSVGGIVGAIESYDGMSTTITKSYSTGIVQAGQGAGGIVGSTYSATFEGASEPDTNITISNSYSRAQVEATADAGGIVGIAAALNDGFNNNVTLEVTKSYFAGDLTAYMVGAGGIIGVISNANDNDQEIYKVNNSFVAGHLQTNDSQPPYIIIGNTGWHGVNTVTLTNNWVDDSRTQADTDTYDASGDTHSVNVGNSEDDYFFNNHSNPPLNTWDFDNIWMQHETDFPTFAPFGDADGIASDVENAGPNNGDANGDDVLDYVQDNVTAILDPVTNHYVVLESDCTTNSGVSMATAPSNTGFSYPAGLMSFTLQCQSGATATVTQYYYGTYDASQIVARKYNPDTQAFTTIPGATVSNVTIGGQSVLKIVYSITDGGPLDLDGEVNGTIIDPSGPGVSSIGAPNTGLAYSASYGHR